jgi:polyhydroxyalkanoate synthesis repressor PhaR
MRIVRRYSNRKLYDTEQSTYLNLSDIAKLTRDGIQIQVVEYETGRDISSTILCEVIFEEIRRGTPASVAGLRRIIVSGLPIE